MYGRSNPLWTVWADAALGSQANVAAINVADKTKVVRFIKFPSCSIHRFIAWRRRLRADFTGDNVRLMKILVLGGTAFVGRAFVDCALRRGHELTLFNRGRRNPDLFPDLEQIHGDRTIDLSGLDGRQWDAVFDTCGYVPRVVKMSAEALKDKADRYLFISSISVFKNFSVPNQDEEAELATLADPLVEEVTGETYGGLKVLCEEAIIQYFRKRAIIVRPGLIVGPTDYTDRFTYWPARMSRGGDVIAPDIKQQPVQIIDVRDLAKWCVQLLERQVVGVFNTTGPLVPYSFEQCLTACAEGCDANLIWVDPDFLKKHEVQPWSDLPLSLDYAGTSNGLCQIDVSRALAAGLTLRPLSETIRDTREWALTRPADHKWRAGLTPEREVSLLREWRER